MRKITKDELLSYGPEQIAGIILTQLQEFEVGKIRPSYYGGSPEAILSFVIAPIWLGKRVENGVEVHDGYVSSYDGDRVSERLQELFQESVDLLWRENLVRQDPTQTSKSFVKLTDRGQRMKVNPDLGLSRILCKPSLNPNEDDDRYDLGRRRRAEGESVPSSGLGLSIFEERPWWQGIAS